MSIHTQINTALDDLAHPGAPLNYEVIVESQILRAMQDERIDIEDFSYYLGRFNRICAQRPRIAA